MDIELLTVGILSAALILLWLFLDSWGRTNVPSASHDEIWYAGEEEDGCPPIEPLTVRPARTASRCSIAAR